MPETLPMPRRAPAPPTSRTRFAALEGPLIIAGAALVSTHLLDLALAGPATSAVGVVGIVAAATVAMLLRPLVSRATRFMLAVPLGLLFAGAAAVAHVLHAGSVGADWGDITGRGAAAGGVLLIAGGCAALAAPAAVGRAGRAGSSLTRPDGWWARWSSASSLCCPSSRPSSRRTLCGPSAVPSSRRTVCASRSMQRPCRFPTATCACAPRTVTRSPGGTSPPATAPPSWSCTDLAAAGRAPSGTQSY